MTRWIGKRGLWGVVAGTAVAAGSVIIAAEPGDVVVFKEGSKDRKVTVTKVNKRPDGSAEIHGKDTAGEVIVWVEGAADAAPAAPATKAAPAAPATKAAPAAPAAKAAPAAPAAKDAGLPKAKARADDPMGSAVAPMPETAAERERRLFNGKLLGRDTPAPAAAIPAPAPPQIAEAGEPKAKTGLLNRIFGKKTTPAPVPAAMPGPTVSTPAVKVGPTTGGEPKVAAPVRPAPPAPAVKAAPTPVATPTPAIPVPMPLPATRPPVAAPAAVPVPTPLPPVVPLPTIPALPGAQSARPGETIHVVLPVGYVPADVAMADDIRPYATALRDALAPSERLVGARGLANGRHGSSAVVKELLFAAARHDPAATVRAGCLDHLTRLGYATPEFVRHVTQLSEGEAGEERDAARLALVRLTPAKW